MECAEIIERHPGPVVLIAPDMQNALRLHDEISQFTDEPVINLADWETLPYDSFSPHQEIISSRLSTLYQLPTMQRGVLILPVNTLMQRVCPHSFLHGHALVMKKGQRLSRDTLRSQLEQAGYRHVDQVMEHGEYATRGALLDLYPMGSDQPYRIDFFDDEIDSLRVFDVDTQRTLEEVDAINLLPAHEFPTDKTAIELFRSQWREQFDVKRDAEHIYQQVSKGTLPAGIEYWQPLFFSEPLTRAVQLFPGKYAACEHRRSGIQRDRFRQDIPPALKTAASTRCARCCHRNSSGCAPMRCFQRAQKLAARAAQNAKSCRRKPPIPILGISPARSFRSGAAKIAAG